MAHDLVIVGAGPAGLAAARYATLKRLDYLVLSRDLGGKSSYSVRIPDMEENHLIRSRELAAVYRSRLESLRHYYRIDGVQRITVRDGRFSVQTDSGVTEEAMSVIVASGTRSSRLNVPGEERFLSQGLGYSARSYSHLFAGKRVFLAGSNDQVLNSALEVSLQAGHVVVALLTGGSFDRSLTDYVAGLPHVELIDDATIVEFRGDEYAQEVVFTTNGVDRTVKADGFFLEPDPVPNTEFLAGTVELRPDGSVPVDARSMAGLDGMFAAGDVTGHGYARILIALGEGAKALMSAYHYLLRKGLLQGRS